jgi:hypothetical protein
MLDLLFRGQLGETVGAELDHLTASIRGVLSTEHNDDGTHSDVTATSLTLQGATVGTIDEIAHDATRFFAEGSAVWTVSSDDLLYMRTSRIGQLVFVQFSLQTTVITTDTSESLFIRLPEFAAIPGRDSGGSLTYQVGGVLYWSDIEHSTSGMGQVSAIAQDFTNAVPSTLLQLDRMRDGTSASSMFGAWPISNNLTIHGSCWFAVQPDNIAVPFYGV